MFAIKFRLFRRFRLPGLLCCLLLFAGCGTVPQTEREAYTSKETLIEAAVAEIAARGFDSVRLRDVAARCSVTTGMLQYYFETREELLTAAFEHAARSHLDRWHEILRAAQGPRERLRAILTPPEDDFQDAQANAVWIELCAHAARDDRFKPLVTRVHEEWHSTLKRAIVDAVAAGLVETRLPVDDVTSILNAVYDGLELRVAASTAGASGVAPRDVMMELSELLLPDAR